MSKCSTGDEIQSYLVYDCQTANVREDDLDDEVLRICEILVMSSLMRGKMTKMMIKRIT